MIDTRRPEPVKVPSHVILIIAVAAIGGLLAAVVSFLGLATNRQASARDVERNRQVVEQVKRLQEIQATTTTEHHRQICLQIQRIIEQIPSLDPGPPCPSPSP